MYMYVVTTVVWVIFTGANFRENVIFHRAEIIAFFIFAIFNSNARYLQSAGVVYLTKTALMGLEACLSA